MASSDGRGFLASGESTLAETRKGKQLVNLRPGAKVAVVRPVPDGADAIAVVGENRKLLVFALSDLPELARGQGVMLQRYRDGGLSDAIAFRLADGLSWSLGGGSGRTRNESGPSPHGAPRGAPPGECRRSGFPGATASPDASDSRRPFRRLNIVVHVGLADTLN